jgi:hypothetical protein
MAGRAVAEPATGSAAFELDRFEWAGDERLEIEGRWLGVRGRRFVRPTLTLRGGGGERRILALLEHKPWDPGADAWLAAFAWNGERKEIEVAELAVAPGVEVVLPAPGEARGRRRARTPKRYSAQITAQSPPEGAIDRDDGAAPARTPARERLEADIAGLRVEVESLRAQLEREAERRERVERERDAAIAARDTTQRELHAAAAERDEATRVRDAALRERADADARREAAAREHDALVAEARGRGALQTRLDAAIRARDALRDERDAARAERDAVVAQRDSAVAEREAAKRTTSLASLPRSSIYMSSRQQSFLALWTPRLVALAICIAFVVIVALLFHGSP